jgi:hypothetical protein
MINRREAHKSTKYLSKSLLQRIMTIHHFVSIADAALLVVVCSLCCLVLPYEHRNSKTISLRSNTSDSFFSVFFRKPFRAAPQKSLKHAEKSKQ